VKYTLLKNVETGELVYDVPPLTGLSPALNNDYIYDIETYPNIFTCAITRVADGARFFFERSHEIDTVQPLLEFLKLLSNTSGSRMVGFNNIGFDYPILHWLNDNPNATNHAICDKATSIIKCENAYENRVWPDNQIVPQLDLFLIHHFDNRAKATSLKIIEFNSRLHEIEDLPFTPNVNVPHDGFQKLRDYNWKDVAATFGFYTDSKPEIEFREKISEQYNTDFMNHNDTKIGKDFFQMRLNAAGTPCNKNIKTVRPQVALRDCVFDYIQFLRPEFNAVKEQIESKVILPDEMDDNTLKTKGIFKSLVADIDGFKFVFGVGGIHGSVESQTILSDDEFEIIDVDVTSYYPFVGIANKLFPAHLSEMFATVYEELYNERKKYPKSTHPMENLLFKLALNGTYGDTNNRYGAFYDPQYMLTVTLNGQFMLCMLAEQMLTVPNLTIIQANTDGITVKLPRKHHGHLETLCEWWESFTGLMLESIEYDRMHIRDVNNYIAIPADGGKPKLKGAYAYDRMHSQNHSQLIVPKAVAAYFVNGKDPEQFIRNGQDIFDYCRRVKTPRRATLHDADGTCFQNVSRYYASVEGVELFKTYPPSMKKVNVYHMIDSQTGELAEVLGAPNKNRLLKEGWVLDNVTKERRMSRESTTSELKGQTVTICNKISDATVPVDYDYYIKEARKLIDPLI